MFKLFNKSFLRFLVGFVIIIVASFILIFTASAYSAQTNAGQLSAVATFLYNAFIR